MHRCGAEAGARTGSGSDGGLTAAAREAVDAAVAGAVEAHVAWWRARTRKRRLVVERAEADGLARAKVLRILDELGQA